MKRLIVVCLLLVLLSGVCYGAVILDDGLVLQGGRERIVMRVGEKVYLRVQHSIWKYPVLRNLEFSSKNPLVAYADTYGWIHAQSAGRTVISVWNDVGANGTVEVVVRGRARAPSWVLYILLILLAGALSVFFLAKRFRCFE